MSIPRLAIQRPVTMFMISAVITLLGVISLTRLPVDLMPEFEQPTLTVRTNYAGVGPLEMEELITRPIEQAVSAVPGIDARRSTLVRRQQPGPAELRLGHRPVGGRRRSAHARRPHAQPPARGRRPADDLQVRLEPAADHADRHRGRLRPGHAARDRAERARAALRARGRRRRGHRQRRRSAARSTSSCRRKRSPRSTCR